MKKSSATSGSFRLPALTDEGILVNVVPYHPHKGDGTILVLSYAKAAEDSSAVMGGPKEPAHGPYIGRKDERKQRQRKKDTGVRKNKRKNHILYTMKTTICSADVSSKIAVRKVDGQTEKGEGEISSQL